MPPSGSATTALKLAFGGHAGKLPGSSLKSMIGHPQGACGAAGVAATLLAMRDGVAPPTINIEVPDPASHFQLQSAVRLHVPKTIAIYFASFPSANPTVFPHLCQHLCESRWQIVLPNANSTNCPDCFMKVLFSGFKVDVLGIQPEKLRVRPVGSPPNINIGDERSVRCRAMPAVKIGCKLQ